MTQSIHIENESKNPLVSILIPVYNREQVVSRAIYSAINQTYKNTEIIIVDNCSTDNTFEVLKEWGEKSDKIYIYKNNENIGPVLNWMKCVEHSNGEYIKILFSDDWISSDCIEKFIDIYQNDYISKNIGFVFSSVVVHEKSGPKEPYKIHDTNTLLAKEEYIRGTIKDTRHFPVSPCCALFRKADVMENLVTEISNDYSLDYLTTGAGIDVLLLLKTAEQYESVYFISDPLIHFFAGNDSITMNSELCLYYLTAKMEFILSNDSYSDLSTHVKMLIGVCRLKVNGFSDLKALKLIGPLPLIDRLLYELKNH